MSDFHLADAYGNPFRYVGNIKSARMEELSLEHDIIRNRISRLKTKIDKSESINEIKELENKLQILFIKKQTTLSNLTNSMLNYRIKRLHMLWTQCVEELCGFEQVQECIAWLELHTQEVPNV